MTLNCLKYHFTLNFQYYELTLRDIIYLFIIVCFRIHVTSLDVRKRNSGP